MSEAQQQAAYYAAQAAAAMAAAEQTAREQAATAPKPVVVVPPPAPIISASQDYIEQSRVIKPSAPATTVVVQPTATEIATAQAARAETIQNITQDQAYVDTLFDVGKITEGAALGSVKPEYAHNKIVADIGMQELAINSAVKAIETNDAVVTTNLPIAEANVVKLESYLENPTKWDWSTYEGGLAQAKLDYASNVATLAAYSNYLNTRDTYIASVTASRDNLRALYSAKYEVGLKVDAKNLSFVKAMAKTIEGMPTESELQDAASLKKWMSSPAGERAMELSSQETRWSVTIKGEVKTFDTYMEAEAAVAKANKPVIGEQNLITNTPNYMVDAPGMESYVAGLNIPTTQSGIRQQGWVDHQIDEASASLHRVGRDLERLAVEEKLSGDNLDAGALAAATIAVGAASAVFDFKTWMLNPYPTDAVNMITEFENNPLFDTGYVGGGVATILHGFTSWIKKVKSDKTARIMDIDVSGERIPIGEGVYVEGARVETTSLKLKQGIGGPREPGYSVDTVYGLARKVESKVFNGPDGPIVVDVPSGESVPFKIGLTQAEIEQLARGELVIKPNIKGNVAGLMSDQRSMGWLRETGEGSPYLASGENAVLDVSGQRFRLSIVGGSWEGAGRAPLVISPESINVGIANYKGAALTKGGMKPLDLSAYGNYNIEVNSAGTPISITKSSGAAQIMDIKDLIASGSIRPITIPVTTTSYSINPSAALIGSASIVNLINSNQTSLNTITGIYTKPYIISEIKSVTPSTDLIRALVNDVKVIPVTIPYKIIPITQIGSLPPIQETKQPSIQKIKQPPIQITEQPPIQETAQPQIQEIIQPQIQEIKPPHPEPPTPIEPGPLPLPLMGDFLGKGKRPEAPRHRESLVGTYKVIFTRRGVKDPLMPGKIVEANNFHEALSKTYPRGSSPRIVEVIRLGVRRRG